MKNRDINYHVDTMSQARYVAVKSIIKNKLYWFHSLDLVRVLVLKNKTSITYTYILWDPAETYTTRQSKQSFLCSMFKRKQHTFGISLSLHDWTHEDLDGSDIT